MKDLKQITVVGLGLLGGSITLSVLRSLPRVKIVGHSHRPTTRQKAREKAIATQIIDDLRQSVIDSDLVILATPICNFEEIFGIISKELRTDCIVTDVGSTKVLPHRWAAKKLPKSVHYVGSHPIAGSEQRGIEYARDDLFEKASCILTTTKKTNRRAVQILDDFWSSLGCIVKIMAPSDHDKIFANVSHLPHILATALINASSSEELKFAGKGFIDTSRIASGPANIWADVLLTNAENSTRSIDKIIGELEKLKKAVANKDRKKIEELLSSARKKRRTLINYKIKRKELLS